MSMMYINGPLVNSQSQFCQLHGFFPRQVGKEALPLAQEFAKRGTLRPCAANGSYGLIGLFNLRNGDFIGIDWDSIGMILKMDEHGDLLGILAGKKRITMS